MIVNDDYQRHLSIKYIFMYVGGIYSGPSFFAVNGIPQPTGDRYFHKDGMGRRMTINDIQDTACTNYYAVPT